jgi:hypothetical protein
LRSIEEVFGDEEISPSDGTGYVPFLGETAELVKKLRYIISLGARLRHRYRVIAPDMELLGLAQRACDSVCGAMHRILTYTDALPSVLDSALGGSVIPDVQAIVLGYAMRAPDAAARTRLRLCSVSDDQDE